MDGSEREDRSLSEAQGVPDFFEGESRVRWRAIAQRIGPRCATVLNALHISAPPIVQLRLATGSRRALSCAQDPLPVGT